MASLSIENVKKVKQIIKYSLIKIINQNSETMRVFKGKSGDVLSPKYGYLEKETGYGVEIEIYNVSGSHTFQDNYSNISVQTNKVGINNIYRLTKEIGAQYQGIEITSNSPIYFNNISCASHDLSFTTTTSVVSGMYKTNLKILFDYGSIQSGQVIDLSFTIDIYYDSTLTKKIKTQKINAEVYF